MDAQAYCEVVKRVFPQIPIRTCTPNQQGWDFFVLEIDDELIFRFPRRAESVAPLQREIGLLAELGDALSVAIPRFDFIARGDDRFPMPFVGYHKIHGVALTSNYLKHANTERIAQQLAAFLSKLHQFPIERAVQTGIPATTAAQWREQYREMYAQVQGRILGLLDAVTRSQSIALWDEFLTADANFQFAPALIHRDLGDEHILCQANGEGLAGVIDWGDICIGDPAIDFVGILLACGRGFTESVLADYRRQVDSAFWPRILFYARIIPFHKILYGLNMNDAVRLKEGLAQLRL